MAEEEENGIEYFGRKKDRKIVLQGFDSDSEGYGGSDSEEDNLKNSPPKADDKQEPEKEEDNDDMFASDEDDEQEDKLKCPNGVDMDEFEREQGLGKYDAEAVDAKEAEDPELAFKDEQAKQRDYYNNIENYDGERPKPKDVQMEAFDLRAEAEQGILDKDMNYVPEKDKDEEKDEAWLADAKSDEIEKARRAQLQMEARSAKSRKDKLTSTESLLNTVINILEPSETPLEALSRLSPRQSKKRKKVQRVLASDNSRKEAVYQLTGACDELMNDKGLPQIYDLSREELMRSYKGETGKEFVLQRGIKRTADSLDENDEKNQVDDEDYGPKIWEFRWLNDDQVNGPYSAYEMKYWQGNYFNDGVEVRRVDEETFRPVAAETFEN